MDMDVRRNASVSGDCEQEQVLLPSCSKLSTFSTTLDDLFSSHNPEVDVGLEWLSVFVEDCFSSSACCLLAPTDTKNTEANSKPSVQLQRTQQKNQCSLQKFSVPGRARSKRKRLSAPRIKNPLSSWSCHLNPKNEPISSDPPLLKQAYWLADSELMVPKKEDEQTETEHGKTEQEVEAEKRSVRKEESFENLVSDSEEGNNNGQNSQMPRRCTHCLAQRTPQWRAGPLGPKTLCNACGVRYKSGRLLPEYRPAKSPTFVSYLHSNSHKKVMEMRMAVLSPVSTSED